jgi:hypothetical protein
MQYWLVKSEPSVWSWDQQVAKGAKGEAWTGVRNFTARQNLVNMKKGDLAFFYHSNEGKEIVGIAESASREGILAPRMSTLVADFHPDPPPFRGREFSLSALSIQMEPLRDRMARGRAVSRRIVFSSACEPAVESMPGFPANGSLVSAQQWRAKQ